MIDPLVATPVCFRCGTMMVLVSKAWCHGPEERTVVELVCPCCWEGFTYEINHTTNIFRMTML